MTDYKLSRRELMGLVAGTMAGGLIGGQLEGAAMASRTSAWASVHNLRCEYLVDPIGLDERTPRLSWNVLSEIRGWRQSAYQILVASTPEHLAAGRGDLWDSGKVDSGLMNQIEYHGTPLVSRQQCFWRARSWDAAGAPTPWSQTAHWEMGLLEENDWSPSVWIGRGGKDASTASPLSDSDPAPYLRREFSSHGAVKRARIYACGLGYADIFLNGTRIGGASQRDPGYTAFDKRALYVTYDVTSLVALGENALGAVLGKGWYDVHDLATWQFENASWRGSQRLRLVLEIEYMGGGRKTIVSDDAWKTSTGPIVRDGIYSGEIYDARLEMPGWSRPGFDEKAWEPVHRMDAPAGKLVARRCPPVAITQNLPAVKIQEVKPGVYVADFGQNFSGHVQLRVTAPAGAAITLRYGELVHADGSLDTSNIDYFMNKTTPPQLFQTDTYICKGGGEEVWEQRFSYSGFQYAEITGFPGAPTPHNLTGRFAHTDLESAGEFSCSDEMLNKIQHATRWSYLSNAQSIPTDCPQREKNGWTGDAHLAAETGLMNFQSASFYTKWLDDIADNQLPNGQVGDIIPSGGWGTGGCHPAWDSAYAIIAWDLYRYLGDRRILERHFDHIARYVDYVAGRLEDDVVPFDSLGDWLPWKTKTPSQLTSTIYLYHDAWILQSAAALLGRDSDFVKYVALAKRIKAGFHQKWYNAATKMYADGEQTAQAMPLFFGLTPDEHRPDVFAALVADIEKQGHVDCGILGAKYILRVLSDGGRADLVHHVVTRKEQPSWAWWITQGATTLWEQWTVSDSHNHIMFGDVSNWFFQDIAGIKPIFDSPGFASFSIRPQVVGGLTWAKGSHASPYGWIKSSWRTHNGQFHLDITIPPNTTAEVWLPTHDAAKVTEGSAPAVNAKGVKFLRQENGAVVYGVGSGTYAFTA